MKINRIGRLGLYMTVCITLIASMFLHSCAEEIEGTTAGHNFSMDFETRAGETAATDLIPKMRLITFTESAGMFHGEVLNITRTANKLTAKVETGKWNLAMISSPEDFTLVSPNTTMSMGQLPMYIYAPATNNGKTESAPELFFQNKLTPTIVANTTSQMDAQLNRAVAKVELVIRKATPNFSMNGDHKIELHDVPTTLSYTGKLLPNASDPTTLTESLKSPITFKNSTAYTGFLEAETVTFIIPAHQGTDFLNDNPTDVIQKKMRVTVDLERTGGGSRFKKTAEIDKVALCNRILRVIIDVNDGVKFETEVLPWERVNVSANVGTGYQNWLYVKKDATGNGLSWSDPLPNIATAITKAGALKAAGKTVNGILVAGGTDASMLYSESFTIPQDIKIFGGWKGETGTELAANDNVSAVYASVGRNLATHKARLHVNTGSMNLNADNTILDGFIISGAGTNGGSLVNVSNSTAWLNAIEIDQQTSLAGNYALSVSNGVATNILVSRNNKGISVTSSGKLVNATIANNDAASNLSGTVLNTIYWGNAGNATIGGTVNNCAFEGTNAPAGTNYPVNAVNNAWFSEASLPGPNFNLGSDLSVPDYAVNTTTPNRGPQLGRGDQASFDQVTTYMLAENKQDINGNPRHHNVTDIGCYESFGEQKGFEFRWNMKDIYISPKINIESDHLALLFDNSEGIYIEWEVGDFVINNSLYSPVTNWTSGNGNTKNLGKFKLKSSSSVNNTSNDRDCGSLVFKCTNLNKTYFPDVQMKVYQSPATSKVWNEGYAGSFHRWNETGPRYVFGVNSGPWTARIISGHDWIKIDEKERPADPYNDTEVEETFGGAVSGNGPIVFRVGMKSTLENADSDPRYGLISITRTVNGQTGAALFFVRQGEKADYLYGPSDYRQLGTRTGAIKFSPYNLTDPEGRQTPNGVDLGVKGGRFVDYPSKTGYHFKYNGTVAYYPDNTGETVTLSSDSRSSWSDSYEPCPGDYFTPSEEQFVHSYFLNRALNESGSGNAVGTTYVWGRLADGYYDKLASSGARYVGTGPNRAVEGLLMYNDYTNASVFFPLAGCRTVNGGLNRWYWNNGWTSIEFIQWTLTRDTRPNVSGSNASNFRMWHTHSHVENGQGHLGLSCTQLQRFDALSVRCVMPAD